MVEQMNDDPYRPAQAASTAVKCIVTIVNGEETIETRACRVIELPDGRPGALWRGFVFPIDGADCIDVSGEGIPPSQCQSHVTTSPARAYAVVEGMEEAWLLVAGDVANRDLAASQLREAGYTVLRAGQWLGEPVDGFDGDWFVRFIRSDKASDLSIELAAILDLTVAPERTSDELRVHLLETELAASRARESSLRAELERVRRTISVPPSTEEAKNSALQTELENERARRNAAEESLQTAERELARVSLAVSTTANSPQPLWKPVRQIGREVEIVFDVLLPQIDPLRGSVVVASSEFRDRRSLYRCLEELQQLGGRTPPGWKKLQGVDGWSERHVSNGEDDAGRLYARFDSASRRWSILLSHKGEQDRDIDWLRKN